jgi:hypothetical protein
MMMLFKTKLGLVIRRHRTRSSIVTQILESSALLSPYLLGSPSVKSVAAPSPWSTGFRLTWLFLFVVMTAAKASGVIIPHVVLRLETFWLGEREARRGRPAVFRVEGVEPAAAAAAVAAAVGVLEKSPGGRGMKRATFAW